MKLIPLAACCFMGVSLWSQEPVATPSSADTRSPEEKKRELCKIEGRTVNLLSGEPVRRAKLTLRQVGGRRVALTAVTDAEGRFLFQNAEPGSYLLSAERTGFLRMEYGARSASSAGAPLTLAAGQRLRDLEFKLTPQGVITGRVVDEEGEPLAGVEVAAMRQRAFGSQRRRR